MDESITFTITSGPYIRTHEDHDACPICWQPLHAGNPALSIDTGCGPVTVCRPCGLDHIDYLLGRTGPPQS